MYRLGQLRRNQISSYSTNVNYKTGLVVNSDETAIDFYDPNITLNEGQISLEYTYYLKFKVKQRADSVQEFTIKLKNNDETLDKDFQSIKTLSVQSGLDYTIFEVVFSPNTTYSQIVFELKRIELDFSTFNPDGKRGRIMDIEVLSFYIIDNIINSYLKSHYSDLKQLKKIGIQGPPGLIFTINGEEIRLGKTGIYELYNDKILISYLGFVIKESAQIPDGKDFFILDFKY